MSKSWECHRCGAVNAEWKGTCDCRPTPNYSTGQTANGICVCGCHRGKGAMSCSCCYSTWSYTETTTKGGEQE